MSTLPTLSSIGENLRTQDNRITADPIFLVQQKVRVYGMDPAYAQDDDKHIWRDIDDEVCDEDRIKELDKMLANGEDLPDDHEPVYYTERWETVQPFFTEQGAKDYLAINSYKLHETRIYVDSAYRNAEWQAIRAFLLSQPAPELPKRSTGIKTAMGTEIFEGDTVTSMCSGLFPGGRNIVGQVVWNEIAKDWQVVEATFAAFYAARDTPASLGTSLSKLQHVHVFSSRSS